MTYKIVITKVENKPVITREWKVVGQVPVTKKDIENAYQHDKIPLLKDSYDYVETSITQDVESQVLIQSVEDMDIPAVIKAINKL